MEKKETAVEADSIKHEEIEKEDIEGCNVRLCTSVSVCVCVCVVEI